MQRIAEPELAARGTCPRRALLVAVSLGQLPTSYLRDVFDMRDTDVRRALAEATHFETMGDD